MSRPPQLFSRWLPVVLYMGLIFGLSSIAHTPPMPHGSDKGAHALLYAGLGALIVRALAGGWHQRVTLTMVVATVVMAAVYGVSDEFHQSFVPPRQVEGLDVLADSIGAGAAALLLFARFRRRSARGRGI